ncbi:hypothetical protein GW17_00057936, partial [Ensete ventricosum]
HLRCPLIYFQLHEIVQSQALTACISNLFYKLLLLAICGSCHHTKLSSLELAPSPSASIGISAPSWVAIDTTTATPLPLHSSLLHSPTVKTPPLLGYCALETVKAEGQWSLESCLFDLDTAGNRWFWFFFLLSNSPTPDNKNQLVIVTFLKLT